MPNSDPSPYPATLGLVLAGGLARRMGGGDKALIAASAALRFWTACWRGCAPQACTDIILNANGDPARLRPPCGLPVIPDSVPDFAGPLAGILAGLDWAAAHATGTEWLASAPGDCPFLPHDLVPRLHEAQQKAGTPLALGAHGRATGGIRWSPCGGSRCATTCGTR